MSVSGVELRARLASTAGPISAILIRRHNPLAQVLTITSQSDLPTVDLDILQVVSSRRYKEDIKPLAAASEALYALKPVSFRLKKEYDARRNR